MSDSTDGAFLDGFLDPVGAATVAAALNAHTQSGDRDRTDTRTPAQRRADALVDVCRQVLDAGSLPSVNGENATSASSSTCPRCSANLGHGVISPTSLRSFHPRRHDGCVAMLSSAPS
ncbi:MAG: 13E12 repeat family protein [Actinomycetota bacterium]|nr:13E12 repeat family protein [Actinomycetota bacterium]